MFRRTLPGLLSALALQACVPTPQSVDALLAEGRQNIVQAHSRHAGEQLTVKGKVVALDLRSSPKVELDLTVGFQPGHAETNPVAKAVVALGPTGDPALGRLLCVFETNNNDQLETINVGDTVVLTGAYVAYRRTEQGLELELEDCYRYE